MSSFYDSFGRTFAGDHWIRATSILNRELTPTHDAGGQIATAFSLTGEKTLHHFTLCAFGIAQPLLTALVKQSVQLLDREIGWTEMIVVLFVLFVIPPICTLLAERIAGYFLGRYGSRAVLFVLFSLVVLPFTRLLTAPSWLKNGHWTALSSFVSFFDESDAVPIFLFRAAVAFPLAVICTLLYERKAWMRLWLTVSSLCLIVFLVPFLSYFATIRRNDAMRASIPVKNPMPVVIIVLDEFSGLTLMNECMEIDSEKFPGFRRLANKSTWYRNATTVSPLTNFAVPAILTGRFPVPDSQPVAGQHPGSLPEIIAATESFEMTFFEPISRMGSAPRDTTPAVEESSIQKTWNLIHDLAIGFPRLVVQRRASLDFAKFEAHRRRTRKKDWGHVTSSSTEGVFHSSWGEGRTQQLDQFLSCLKSSSKPRFSFLHVVFPHCPWTLFANGDQYLNDVDNSETSPPGCGFGLTGLGWCNDGSIVLRNEFRYRQQVGSADRFIGQLLDRLDETGILDQCLLVVTADHGCSFRANHSFRFPDAENLSDILSIPLFIKLPGQADGRVDDANVESIDLLPTIADVLGFDPPEPVDGTSVFNTTRRPRKTLFFDGSMTIIEPHFPQRSAAVKRQAEIFGNLDLDQLPEGAAIRPEWYGRDVTNFTIEDRKIACLFEHSGNPKSHSEGSPNLKVVPGYVSGCVATRDLPEIPAEIVVAVDGVIRDTGRTFPISTKTFSSTRTHGFSFLLPRKLFVDHAGEIALFVVNRSGDDERLTLLSNVQ